MSIIINPGTGPVADASRPHAEYAIEQFIADLDLDGVTHEFVKECQGTRYDDATKSFVETGPDGRYEYVLRLGERQSEIEMPGLPIDRVRYVGAPDQNIWDFPRLYVDGSSWIWCFGINCAKAQLTGEDEDDE